jgi:hypothetical protein
MKHPMGFWLFAENPQVKGDERTFMLPLYACASFAFEQKTASQFRAFLDKENARDILASIGQ